MVGLAQIALGIVVFIALTLVVLALLFAFGEDERKREEGSNTPDHPSAFV